jgi:hypothetical protein
MYGGYEANISAEPLRNSKRNKAIPKNPNPIYPINPSGTRIDLCIFSIKRIPHRHMIMYMIGRGKRALPTGTILFLSV